MTTYKVLGLMSGTSLDGLDLAFCHLQNEGASWRFNIKAHKNIAYESGMREQLKNAIFLNGEALLLLHNEYGAWLGRQAKAFIEEAGLEVDMIASHGHTAHHQPQQGLTFQLGSGQELATASGVKTISDFRTKDVTLGGQGAPLVPIGDRLLFREYDYCLNLGGISNISFERDGKRIAYDIGLANMPLNFLCRHLDMGYDKGGNMARSGEIIPELYHQLNSLGYYQLPYPKSTGYEWFLQEVVPLLDAFEAPLEDLLHTSIQHICEQVAVQIQKVASGENQQLLVSGGGALNTFLMEVLRQRLGNKIQVVLPPKLIIEYKEALVFALMGALRSEGRINVLASVTGASRDSSSGVIHHP